MDELKCLQKLTKLDEQREAVESAMNQFVVGSSALTEAIKRAADNSNDAAAIKELNQQLSHFNGPWGDLDDALKTWDKTMLKFRQEVLDTVLQRIKRDKTLKELKTACDSIIVYAEWSEREVKLLRVLLDLWRTYYSYATTIADQWGKAAG
jgi:hypothetical protein